MPEPIEILVTDVVEERNSRSGPATLDEFVGQSRLKAMLNLMLKSAQKRKQAIEHLLFYGLPGLGKTTLAATPALAGGARVIASEMGAALKELAAPALNKPGDLASVLVLLQERDVLFLDEIHRLLIQVKAQGSARPDDLLKLRQLIAPRNATRELWVAERGRDWRILRVKP
jgi:Holliday junction DNA helicase RuvB